MQTIEWNEDTGKWEYRLNGRTIAAAVRVATLTRKFREARVIE